MTIERAESATASQRASASRLSSSVRRLMRSAVVTELCETKMDFVSNKVDELTRYLGQPVRSGALRPSVDAPAKALGERTSLETSVYSAFGIPLSIDFSADGNNAVTEFVPDELLEGPMGAMHGGIVAWVFDVIFGVLIQASVGPALTASLDVQYKRPTPLKEAAHLQAWIERSSGRRSDVHGSITSGGRITATAEGVFVSSRD